MAEGQQVVSNIHAVVMVNGSQLGKLLKVLLVVCGHHIMEQMEDISH